MGRMRKDDGMGFVPPHAMNQNSHHCSYTCVKSRAQVVTEEQQMLHLHDGSRMAPAKLEFTSEPQWQSSSHRQQREAGIKTPLPQTCSQHWVLPPHPAFSTDHPHPYETVKPNMSPPRPQHSSKRGHSYFKRNYGGTRGSHQSVPPNLTSCHLPSTVRRQKRQKPRWRKTAAAATVPLGRVLNGSQIPSNKSKCTDPIVCINLCTGACTPPHY